MNKEDIFNINDVRKREVKVPEWNTIITVATLSGTDRAKLKLVIDRLEKQNKMADLETWVVIFCAVDDFNKRIFEFEDFDKLNSKSADILLRIAKEALQLNGIINGSIEEKKSN